MLRPTMMVRTNYMKPLVYVIKRDHFETSLLLSKHELLRRMILTADLMVFPF